MSVEIVKKAGRLHLATLSPALPTAYEAIPFDPDAYPDSLYQFVQFVPLRPDDPVIGDKYYRERMQMQIFISGPNGQGTAAVGQRAELVRSHFQKGTFVLQDGVKVYVLRTPSINAIGTIQNRVVTSVMIDLVGEVFS